VLKHAQATELTILLSFKEIALEIIVKDNGKGFDTTNIEKNQSLGLRNINNRVALLKASLHIDSKQGQGTEIKIEIPKNGLNDK